MYCDRLFRSLMSSQIAVYAGPGVDSFCLEAINRQLDEIANLNCHKITQFTDPNDLWKDPKSLRAIVIPGGNAAVMWGLTWHHQAFIIKKYMESYPISYYGICAGAILASAACFERARFTTENHFSNLGHKYLGIFPGYSIAPIYYSKDRGELTISDFKSPLLTYDNISLETPHILSPGFIDCDKLNQTSCLSSYPDLIDCTFLENNSYRSNYVKFQAGIVKAERIFDTVFYEGIPGRPILLTGSHFELDSKALTTDFFNKMFNSDDDLEHKKIVVSFEKNDILRKKVLQKNFEKLQISCINTK